MKSIQIAKSSGKVLKERSDFTSLGVDTHDTLKTVRMVRAGLPFRRLAKFQKISGLSWEMVGHFVAIPQRTLTRRQSKGRLSPEESDRVLRAATLLDLAVDLFEGDTPAAVAWLQTPQRALGGEAPLEFASTTVGAREVENLIVRLEHGVFS